MVNRFWLTIYYHRVGRGKTRGQFHGIGGNRAVKSLLNGGRVAGQSGTDALAKRLPRARISSTTHCRPQRNDVSIESKIPDVKSAELDPKQHPYHEGFNALRRWRTGNARPLPRPNASITATSEPLSPQRVGLCTSMVGRTEAS